jgi:hypothetical protein
MSQVPFSQPAPPEHDSEQPSPSPPNRFERWHRKVLGICLVTFALELGLFLIVYPWTRGWALNFLPVRVGMSGLLDIWMSYSLRAAVSALGVIDVWIAGAEFWRLVKPNGS